MDIRTELLKYRLEAPKLVQELALKRRKRLNWEKDKLVILAIDHPARRVTAAGGNPWAMANRADLLRRTALILMQHGVDGLLATPDIMEEIFWLNDWSVQRGGPDFLQDKILIGSMNRAGLAETVFELDDFVSAYTPQAIFRQRLDAGKLLYRLNPESRDSGKTIRYCVDAMNELDQYELPCFLEPLVVASSTYSDAASRVNAVDDLVRLVGVATAMGASARNRWLKLPMVRDFERVAAATTCPIVLLGGNAPGTTDTLLQNIADALTAGPNVRGVMIGRGVLYPADGADPVEVAAEIAATVHGKKQEVQRWNDLSSIH